MHTEVAHHAIRVTDSLRELLKMMNFHEIPEQATYVAFFDDGEVVFLLGEIKTKSPLGVAFPSMSFIGITYHENVEIELEDE